MKTSSIGIKTKSNHPTAAEIPKADSKMTSAGVKQHNAETTVPTMPTLSRFLFID